MPPVFRLILLCLALPIKLCAQDDVQFWRKEAIRQHPDLAVEGSAFNRKFLEAYKEKQASSPEFFTKSDWPAILADKVQSQIEQEFPGSKVIDTLYVGNEELFGHIVPYERTAQIRVTAFPKQGTQGSFLVSFVGLGPEYCHYTFSLSLTPDQTDTFASFIEKAVEWDAKAVNEDVKSYTKSLGTIDKREFVFRRTSTGKTIVSVMLDDGGKWPKEEGNIELEGVTAAIKLLKMRQTLVEERQAADKQDAEAKQKADKLFSH